MSVAKFAPRQLEDFFVNSNWTDGSCVSSRNVKGKGYLLLQLKPKDEMQKRITISVVTA